MKNDDLTINRICNSLNAQSSLSRHKYANTKDKREQDLSIILGQTQMLITSL